MKKTLSFALLFTLNISQYSYAHSHKTYIVEQPAPTYVVIQPQVQAPTPTYIVMAESAPPAEFQEETGICPGANYVWIRGVWQWDGAHWIRVHGHWALRPHASAIWVPGSWKEHHHHWKWSEGYWQ